MSPISAPVLEWLDTLTSFPFLSFPFSNQPPTLEFYENPSCHIENSPGWNLLGRTTFGSGGPPQVFWPYCGHCLLLDPCERRCHVKRRVREAIKIYCWTQDLTGEPVTSSPQSTEMFCHVFCSIKIMRLHHLIMILWWNRKLVCRKTFYLGVWNLLYVQIFGSKRGVQRLAQVILVCFFCGIK